MRHLLLLVDDEPAVLDSLYRILKQDKTDVLTASTVAEAQGLLQRESVSFCLVNHRTPGMDGLEFLRHLGSQHPEVACALMSGHASVDLAVLAMRQGACDFLTKPFTRGQVEALVERALANLRRRHLTSSGAGPDVARQNIVGPSPAMRRVLQLVEQVGPSSANVLIQGESGTGKELVATAIQQLSRRRAAPYVRVNCAAIPDSLMESELFGHERGAFTGAHKSKKGKFELADGGTIFLDEIGDMSANTQTKLLRVLQEGEFDRVGGTRTQKVDVRIIAATNADLERLVEERRFREDLYYRLRVIQVQLPPLRDRKPDIPLLVDHFIRRYAAKDGKKIVGIESVALGALTDHQWPGNVRELENAIERAVVLARGERLGLEDLPPEVLQRSPEDRISFPVGTSLEEVERRMIAETLRYTDGDKTKAARILGITARTIYRKLERRRRELMAIQPDRKRPRRPEDGRRDPVQPQPPGEWSRTSSVKADVSGRIRSGRD